MSQCITLLGSEQVQSAGSNMREAASTMHHAASNLDESMRIYQRNMDDWLVRLESILDRHYEKMEAILK